MRPTLLYLYPFLDLFWLLTLLAHVQQQLPLLLLSSSSLPLWQQQLALSASSARCFFHYIVNYFVVNETSKTKRSTCIW